MLLIYGVLALLAVAMALGSILVLKVGQARRASRTPGCYFCGGTALHLSTPKGLTDQLLTFWDCVPYRCEICFRRHYRLTAEPADDRS